MGIQAEFNPDLALRNIREFKEKRRSLEECIPERMEAGRTYEFLKEGQRLYWLEGECPLVETEGNGKLSRPLASIRILEATHFLYEGKPYTRGLYRVIEVFDPNDPTIHFEGWEKKKQK
jgi:hypothetical protein